MQNKYGIKLIVNDKFTPLYNFWKQVKINKTVLCDKLKEISSISKNEFIDYRKSIMSLNNNILEQAISYFIINRCSFNGSTLSGGFSLEASKKRFTKSSINNIELLDFSNIDNDNDNDNDKKLIFLDPPYYLDKKSKLYGNNGDMHENFNHQLLYELIKTKRNWIMTYNNCDYIKELYKDFIIINVNWTYGMNNNKKSSEIVIISQ